MLVEARRYRLAALAFVRNSGSESQLAQATGSSRANIRRLLRGKYGFLTPGKARGIESLLSEREREWVQEAPRWPVLVGQVPCELIAPVIAESFQKYGRAATAKTCETVERQLFALTQERRGVRFELADRIVTRLAGPGWWSESPERQRFYWNSSSVFGRTPPVYVERRSARRRALVAV